MSRWSLVGAWVIVALIASGLTWQIVSAADAQVSDRPVAPLQVAAPVTDSTSGTAAGSSSTTQPSATSSTSPVTTAVTSSPTSSPPDGGSSASTATTAAAAWSVDTIETPGGSVVVSYRPGEVVYNSAVPVAGFSVELKKEGPPVVEVEFESESAKYEVTAQWSNGRLSVETESDVDAD
jgi:hypothetical protein